MSTGNFEQLQEQIERLVREHLTGQRKAAAAAVERAFASAAAPRSRAGVRSAPSRRRTAAEMADLAERLCEAVRENSGETMITIAAQLGELPRALNRPMVQLKRSGRVRSAGQRHLTRYFPMASSKAS